MRSAFIERLQHLSGENAKIMLVTGDLGFGVLDDFAKTYPQQYLNVGVAEQNMTGIATGLALSGRIVFTYSIGNFPTLRCLEQIRNDACYHEANVKVVAIGGGFSYGPLGYSHHATEDFGILRTIPNLTMVAPGDAWEVEEATQALVNTPGTCYMRLDKSAAARTNQPGECFRLGKARVVRHGDDITLIVAGGILGVVVRAAERLAELGIQCRVVSMHTMKPFDKETVLQVANETGGIVTVEEHVLNGGLGSAVAETCLDAGVVPALFCRMGLRDQFSTIVGSQAYLREKYGLGEQAIVDTVSGLLQKRLHAVE